MFYIMGFSALDLLQNITEREDLRIKLVKMIVLLPFGNKC